MTDGERQSGSLITGIIADDLTGGVLVASSLVEQGILCPIVTRPSALDFLGDSLACVVAGRFRLAPPEEAVQWFDETQRALTERAACHIIYKYCATFDSTDCGNIGPCADALMQSTGADRLGFCTAFPSRGVTVYQGHIFLGSELLCNSDKRFDPVTPMPDSDLVAVLGRQTRREVMLVPRSVLADGVEATRCFIDAAVDRGAAYFLFDAIDDADIAVCAEVTETWPAMTGGDSLLAALPARHIKDRKSVPIIPPLPPGATAVIAGSCAGATLRQLERFADSYPVRQVVLADAAEDFDSAVADAMAWAGQQLPKGPVALSVAQGPEDVKRIQARLGVTEAKMLGERVCRAMACGLQALGVSRFIVAGGETSGAVADAIRLDAMHVYPLRDIPGGLCLGDAESGLCCYFKAGKMGSETILLDLVEIMGQGADDD
ncbi:four-carbon acid sugar kinase family protein [Hoeflea prorocentri]|uniref:Four-carbon acid sugar kinase family protein n=1 Tax=Hoeflea prorocentri TaxID=1922333 RepID=A0A9X3UJS1_9HYPH|nr:four-carbon acid sugar kinase family protein [Hoeflea prorocentri]MCY6381892.1 four-carbon acid sugar kinase family protein [Hoeflea prorocentri]MDA5399692.1 four-carbon acid sugar kinase family protein [Hoeflea prorocentri]